MVSPSSPIPAELSKAEAPPREATVLIAGLGDELAADYIAHLAQLGWSEKKAPDAGPGLRSLHV